MAERVGSTLYVSTSMRSTWIWAENPEAVTALLGVKGTDWFPAYRGGEVEPQAVDLEIGCCPAGQGLEKLRAAGYQLQWHPESGREASPVWGVEVRSSWDRRAWEPTPLAGRHRH
jgi:hypothetical protein